MSGRRHRLQCQWHQLEKQVSQSEYDFRVYGVKRIRNKALEGLACPRSWDYPYRVRDTRSWKRYRDKQYKVKQ